MQQTLSECQTPVLLVCVYNKSGAIITHDQFCELFSKWGEVQRVLIFKKAKVWKTFIEMESRQAAELARQHLDNKPILPDGSKMNIFPSALKKINFQNSNLGGVDYSQLKKTLSVEEQDPEKPARIRSQTHWAHNIFQEKQKSVFSDLQTEESPKKSQTSNISLKSSTQFVQCSGEDSDSPPKIRKRQESWNNWCDVDAQFRELALQSSEYREMVSETTIRPKSKSIIPANPYLQQYLLENSPSKVLFVRSIPSYHNINTVYNIMLNFGNIRKIVNIKHKESMLVEYEHIDDATQSKDFLNCVKNGMRIFFSHYDTLVGRKVAENQQCEEYIGTKPKKDNFNPPSEVLHITYLFPDYQQEFFAEVKSHGEIVQYSWQKLPSIGKWMLLIKMKNIEESLRVMGFLQNVKINNRNVKISFTRSKLES